MAPIHDLLARSFVTMNTVFRRDDDDDDDDDDDCWGWRRNCNKSSRWHDWGRWVVAGVAFFIVIVALFAFYFFAQRRRRAGRPVYGTNWMGPGPKRRRRRHHGHHKRGFDDHEMDSPGSSPGMYYPPAGGYGQQRGFEQAPPGPGYGGYNNQPPAYGQQQQPQYTGSSFNPNDGYYGGDRGVQPPPHAYQPDNYGPPPGPPPGKGGGKW